MSHANRPVIAALGAGGGVSTLRIGRQLARREAADLIVASVVEPPAAYDIGSRRTLFVPWTIDAETDERRRHVQERVQRLERGFAAAGPSKVLEVVVSYGDVATQLTALATERNASLIVMGLGPHAVARRLLSAGTAWKTSRKAPCPVLAVSERARSLPQRAVIATDFGAESIHAAREALRVLADGAHVTIVHAWSRFETLLPVKELTRLNEEYAASLPERFARFREALGHHGTLVFHDVALEGKPSDVVLSVARQQQADLLVAGTHGYGTLERWVLGSTSTALLRSADCSVLLAPSPSLTEATMLSRHMNGTSTLRSSETWDEELRAFAERNHDRLTLLEIDDVAIGAQVQESGYPLAGASYDPHDHRVALMFGGSSAGAPHLTRSLGGIRSVSVASSSTDVDIALCIESDAGRAVLTFPAPVARGADDATRSAQ